MIEWARLLKESSSFFSLFSRGSRCDNGWIFGCLLILEIFGQVNIVGVGNYCLKEWIHLDSFELLNNFTLNWLHLSGITTVFIQWRRCLVFFNVTLVLIPLIFLGLALAGLFNKVVSPCFLSSLKFLNRSLLQLDSICCLEETDQSNDCDKNNACSFHDLNFEGINQEA